MSKPDFFAKLDGTGRAPREAQANILRELQDKWDDWDTFAVVVPTGGGKSLLARSIQNATNAAYITANNVLVKQYADVYNANYFIGAEHMPTARYDEARLNANDPEFLNCFNPCSFRIAAKSKQFRHPDVIVFDEADTALSLLQELASTTLSITGKEAARKGITVPSVAAQVLLNKAAEKRADAVEFEIKKKKKQARQAEAGAIRLEDVAELLISDPERYAISLEEKWTKFKKVYRLKIAPTFLPLEAARRFFRDSKIILLSSTLLPSDVIELTGGRKFIQLETESPIPVERRKIYFKPCEETLSAPVNYDMLAAKLDEVIRELPLGATIIHTVYADALELHARMKTPTLVYSKVDKQEVLDEFMRKGGVVLASGATTGLDLRQDLARVNIVSKLLFPSLGADIVQKRLALPSGKRSYALAAAREFIQACGRSTRSETDWSVTVVLDGRLARLYRDTKEDWPNFIKSAIVWNEVPYEKIREEVQNFLQT